MPINIRPERELSILLDEINQESLLPAMPAMQEFQSRLLPSTWMDFWQQFTAAPNL